MELSAADQGTTNRETVTAASLHDWQSAPPRLQARDVARSASLFGGSEFDKTVSERAAGPRSGSKPEQRGGFDVGTRLAEQERTAFDDNAALYDAVFQSRTLQAVGVDERHPDERYVIGISILQRPYTVELVWQRHRRWSRWLVVCPQCERRKRYLVMRGELLVCAKCAGVRARASLLPPILAPVAALTRAEQAESKAREVDRRRRRWARAAGRQVFAGQVTIG